MVFNSLQFLFFFTVVFFLYCLLKHRWQNWLLIIASCAFYAAWSWKFLFLMFASISIDYWCSQRIARTENPQHRKLWLWLSISANLGILGFFKYCNFFIGNIEELFRHVHLWPDSLHLALKITLPLGISFYTFEAISYIVDVYNRKIKPSRSYWDYVLFVIYFPHLIAGPIMRAKDFLPQISSPRKLNLEQFYEGCFLFFWGLFEKIYVADNLARIVNPVFAGQAPYNGGEVLLAIYAFSFQILCDFDGYSNMARGLGKCMGFDITINFRQPYFSANPREFWQRWHISLSSWLRDYLYIPLGGNKIGELLTYRNLILVMLLGGLWHGASWTFVLWGLYHGLLLAGHRLIVKYSWFKEVALGASPLWKLLKMVAFFHWVALGWLLFRATSLQQAGDMFYALCTSLQIREHLPTALKFLLIILPLLVIQWGQFKANDILFLYKRHPILKIAAYALMTYLIVGFGVMKAEEFIYFQF